MFSVGDVQHTRQRTKLSFILQLATFPRKGVSRTSLRQDRGIAPNTRRRLGLDQESGAYRNVLDPVAGELTRPYRYMFAESVLLCCKRILLIHRTDGKRVGRIFRLCSGLTPVDLTSSAQPYVASNSTFSILLVVFTPRVKFHVLGVSTA